MKIHYLLYYTTIDKSLLYQIHSHYSFFHYNKECDRYRYGSKARQKVKYELGYKDIVEDHHIIPKEFKDHLFIKDIGFDVGCSRNIHIMTKWSHRNRHHEYNKYVKDNLDELYQTTNFDESKYKFILFFWYLESQLDKS